MCTEYWKSQEHINENKKGTCSENYKKTTWVFIPDIFPKIQDLIHVIHNCKVHKLISWRDHNWLKMDARGMQVAAEIPELRLSYPPIFLGRLRWDFCLLKWMKMSTEIQAHTLVIWLSTTLPSNPACTICILASSSQSKSSIFNEEWRNRDTHSSLSAVGGVNRVNKWWKHTKQEYHKSYKVSCYRRRTEWIPNRRIAIRQINHAISSSFRGFPEKFQWSIKAVSVSERGAAITKFLTCQSTNM